MSTIATIIELIKILLSAYKFITNEISEAQFNSAVKERKEFRDKFSKATRAEKLRMLRDKN